MRVRIFLSKYDIREACKRKSDYFSDVELSINDVQYISADELLRLIKANPEYIPIIKNALAQWSDEE